MIFSGPGNCSKVKSCDRLSVVEREVGGPMLSKKLISSSHTLCCNYWSFRKRPFSFNLILYLFFFFQLHNFLGFLLGWVSIRFVIANKFVLLIGVWPLLRALASL